jgi:hypothetical protein
VKRFAGVRFADVLAANERDATSRSIASAGASVTSWNVAAGRTYARLSFEAGTLDESTLRDALPSAVTTIPPCTIVCVTPDRPSRELVHALCGPGRPLGIVSSAVEAHTTVIDVDTRTTPLSTIVALVDASLAGLGRRIEPLFSLRDDELADVASAVLGDPAIDATRLIETYLEPLLERANS